VRHLDALVLMLAILPMALAGCARTVQVTPKQTQVPPELKVQSALLAAHQQARSQMISSLTPLHRVRIGGAIGEYAVADKLDENALTKRIGAILSPPERAKVTAALSAYQDEFKAQILRDIPENAKALRANLQNYTPPPTDASVALVNWLLTLDAKSLGPASDPAFLVASQYSGPSDQENRVQMRSSMLAALTTDHRSKVGQAIGQFVVSPAPDDVALSQSIDQLLSGVEKQQVLNALSTFVVAQRTARAKWSKAVAKSGYVLLSSVTPSPTSGAPDAGAVLWRALLMAPRGAMVAFGVTKPHSHPRATPSASANHAHR
jgi:hypothetical protein